MTSAAALHVRHCPDDLSVFIVKGFRAEADVSLAGSQEHFSISAITTEVRGGSRFKEVLLPTGRRSMNGECCLQTVCEAAPLCSDPKKELNWFDILHDTCAEQVFSDEFT